MARNRASLLLLTVCIQACATARIPEPAPHGPPPGRAEPPHSWLDTQRLDETGQVPPLARARALEQVRARGEEAAGLGSWTPAGPINVGGRVSALAVDPNDTERIWLGAAAGGVFLSEDGGNTWASKFADQTAFSIGALTTHPTSSDVVYVGTGEETGGGWSFDGEGVLRTIDGGASWTNLGLAEVRRIGKLAIDPTDPDRIFVAAVGGLHNRDEHRGVYRSIDGGAAWQKVLYVQDDAGATDLAIDPQNPDRIFASIWQRSRADHASYYGGAASGIYRSIDGGDSWTPLTNGLPGGVDVGRIGLAIAPSNPQIVYAVVVRTPGSLDGIYRSTDGGDAWTKMSSVSLARQFSGFGYYFGQIRVDPTDPDTVYALDIDLWRSLNGGSTFQAIGATLHVDQHALIVGPANRLLVGNDGGFYRSVDGSSFVHNQTLAISQFYDICIDPRDARRRFGGLQDNGTQRTTGGGLASWQRVLGGDGMHCAIDAVDSNVMYAEAQWGLIFRSVDGGSSFSAATVGIASGERHNWVTPIANDPSISGRVYTGTQRVYRSDNSGTSWTAVSDDLSGHDHQQSALELPEDHDRDPIQGTVTAIGISPLDSQIVWAGTDDGNVWVSDDGASSWTQVNPPGPAHWVTEIAPDPHDVDAAWLTVAGYRLNDTLPYVRRTENLGQSWSELSAGLPIIPMNSVAPDPLWKGRVFAASDIGVFLSDDGGLVWQLLSAGMPYVVVIDLVLDPTSRTLFAGTHGRSLFSFDLDQLPVPDGDGDGVDNNADCALADPGAFGKPGEIPALRVDRGSTDEALLAWTDAAPSAGPGTFYDVAGGALAALSQPFTVSPLFCDLDQAQASDPDPLAPGEGHYYFVRARNVCGTGPWGVGTGDRLRFVLPCP